MPVIAVRAPARRTRASLRCWAVAWPRGLAALGGARTWLDIGSFSDEWDALLSLSGNQLTSTPAEATRPTRHYTVALSGGQLTLTSTDATFDFTMSGAAGVPATEKTVLVPN